VNESPLRLVEIVQQIAVDLPSAHVEALASRLDRIAEPGAAERHQILSLVAAPRFRDAVARLWDVWEQVPTIAGATLAMMLRSAVAVASSLRADQSIDIAWTGPTSVHVPVRMGSQVLIDLIDEAKTQLFVVSFAAYKVDRVTQALRGAADRGVDVRLILDTKAASKGNLRRDAAEAFTELHGVASFWVWPLEKRPELGASMHAKAVIVDRRTALVTSANLTGAAMERNMELGLVIQGGSVPQRLADHFLALTAAGALLRIQPF
jgi:phosphatidylserine/phosphatidylglycerophosphate/cardiolipin synthase-like enzyme